MHRPSITDAAKTGLADHQVEGRKDEYLGLFDETHGGSAEARKSNYMGMVNNFYDLVTDFYENGWGQSFHFAARFKGEGFKESIARHEHYIAHRLGMVPGQNVLDVGCGVGGPMRAIARFSGANVMGINNNDYQIERGHKRNRDANLAHLCDFTKGDFLKMPFTDGSFDGAYAIEATCHAPDRVDVFSEIYRVLKPGSLFASYEWCLTDGYRGSDPEHRRIKKGIEEGDALPDLVHTSEVIKALETCGFEVLDQRDMAYDCDPETPWYLPLSSKDRSLVGLRNSPMGRQATQMLVDTLEKLKVAPKGSGEVHRFLCTAANALVEGGEQDIFTPMFFVLARKPA